MHTTETSLILLVMGNISTVKDLFVGVSGIDDF